jgi:hypothetical protein
MNNNFKQQLALAKNNETLLLARVRNINTLPDELDTLLAFARWNDVNNTNSKHIYDIAYEIACHPSARSDTLGKLVLYYCLDCKNLALPIANNMNTSLETLDSLVSLKSIISDNNELQLSIAENWNTCNSTLYALVNIIKFETYNENIAIAIAQHFNARNNVLDNVASIVTHDGKLARTLAENSYTSNETLIKLIVHVNDRGPLFLHIINNATDFSVNTEMFNRISKIDLTNNENLNNILISTNSIKKFSVDLIYIISKYTYSPIVNKCFTGKEIYYYSIKNLYK